MFVTTGQQDSIFPKRYDLVTVPIYFPVGVKPAGSPETLATWKLFGSQCSKDPDLDFLSFKMVMLGVF